MRSSHSRIAAGVLIALALGTFGPISRAVSMESRRHVDVQGPGYNPFRQDVNQAARRGATAVVSLGEGTNTHITLRVDEAYLVRATSAWNETRVAVDEMPRVSLRVDACDEEGCSERRYTGAGTFTITDDPTGPRTRTLSATLSGPHGTCTVDARWVVTGRAEPRFGWSETGTTARASGTMGTSCLGDHAWAADGGEVYDTAGAYQWYE